ncbi:hypothetical protein PGTUg99_032571 [Puccinia graminis f. sp. tritici]|uniref:Uncharacterized protein n=1 Tax=Puccinia graminis f. sp. tritici TaxID=56615 RepID=A0A5B0P5K8_PUCGR|nr:hypothetical protein PGTUg99_032571 [Puccinia graminis f. sp. tritici]
MELLKAKQAPAAEQTSAAQPIKAPKKSSTRVPKKVKKPISPEIVPSEWDTSSDEATKSDKPKPTSSIAPGLKKSSTTSDPFKSNKPIEKLIDSEILKNISIKKSVPKETPTTVAVPIIHTTESVKRVEKQQPDSSHRPIDSGAAQTTIHQASVSSASPSLPKISNDASVQKKLENYFVPQGRTTRSISSSSSILPSGSFTTEPYEPADSSDLDIITGATAQLWSKPKTSKEPQEDDILQRYRPSFHPLLQTVKLQREYYRKALETKDEDLKIVVLRAASSAQSDLLRAMNQEEFLNLFNRWDPIAEYQDYLTGQAGRNYWKKEGVAVTPSPSPEVEMRPPEAVQRNQTTDSSIQHPAQMNLHYPVEHPPPSANLQQYELYRNAPNNPETTQGYQQHPAVAHHRPYSANNRSRNRNRNSNNSRNQEYRAANFRPRNSNGPRHRTNSQTARENRRIAHQRSIHQEMIRLNRTTQAQYQALEAMREQNVHGHELSPQLAQQLPVVPAKLQVEPLMENYPRYYAILHSLSLTLIRLNPHRGAFPVSSPPRHPEFNSLHDFLASSHRLHHLPILDLLIYPPPQIVVNVMSQRSSTSLVSLVDRLSLIAKQNDFLCYLLASLLASVPVKARGFFWYTDSLGRRRRRCHGLVPGIIAARVSPEWYLVAAMVPPTLSLLFPPRSILIISHQDYTRSRGLWHHPSLYTNHHHSSSRSKSTLSDSSFTACSEPISTSSL